MGSFLRLFSKPDLSSYITASKAAMQELCAERFNSKTLKTFYSNDEFVSTKPNTVIVQSKITGKPVEIVYELTKQKCSDFIDSLAFGFFKSFDDNWSFGYKDFLIKRPFFGLGKPKFMSGLMSSNVDHLVGIGIRQDELQVREALKMGVKKIPRFSTPKATLYHVRMGYMPKPKLIRIRHPQKIKVEIDKLATNAPDVKKEFFTPIIVEKKGLFGTRYYLDVNTTNAIANIRQIKYMIDGKPILAKSIRFSGEHIPMELSGDGLETWKRMLDGTHVFK